MSEWRWRATTALILCLAAISAGAARAESGRTADIIVECAQCHGADGIAIRAGAPNLAGKSKAALLAQLRAFRAGRRAQHPEMRKMSRDLTRRELAAIASHFARMPPQ